MGGPGWFRGPHRPGCGGRSCCSSSHIHCTQGRCHCTQGCCCTCSCSCNLHCTQADCTCSCYIHCTQADCTCSCNLHCPCPCSIRKDTVVPAATAPLIYSSVPVVPPVIQYSGVEAQYASDPLVGKLQYLPGFAPFTGVPFLGGLVPAAAAAAAPAVEAAAPAVEAAGEGVEAV